MVFLYPLNPPPKTSVWQRLTKDHGHLGSHVPSPVQVACGKIHGIFLSDFSSSANNGNRKYGWITDQPWKTWYSWKIYCIMIQTAVYLFSEATQVYMDVFCCYLVTYLCITTGEGILMTCAWSKITLETHSVALLNLEWGRNKQQLPHNTFSCFSIGWKNVFW